MHPCYSLILSVPDHQVKELQRETACHLTLQTVKKAILDALPDTKDELSAAIHHYFDIRDELSLRDGVIFKSKPCIIPPTRRQKIKQKLDDSHTGVQSFFRRARETVYWPCMNAEIADYTQKCDVCMSFQSTPTKRNHLSVMNPHQGPGRKLPLTSSHFLKRIIPALHNRLPLAWVL